MRILGMHNRYQIRGGEEECYEAEVALLRQHGHDVDLYEETNDSIAEVSKLSLAAQTVWSRDTYKAIHQRLSMHPYDLVHVQNFFPLISPSIFYAAQAVGVPVVQTLHNYRLVCPNGLFFRQGKVCEDCIGKPVPYPGVVHGCYRENRLATAGVAAMLSVHRALSTWDKQIDCYIALTEFARDKFIEGGLPAHKIVVKPHFISPDPGVGSGEGGYALFVGRISVEKGLDTLLTAWRRVHSRLALKLVGAGPLADWVKKQTEDIPNVEYLGRRPLDEVYDLMGEATMQIFPSKWYETFGRVAVEAYAKGTPVMAAKHGAIAELVTPGETGWHFQPGNAESLIAQINCALDDPAALRSIRKSARAEFEAKYTAARSYQQLMEIYERVANVQSANASYAAQSYLLDH
ncbi:MAG: glycosyltransferase family 4 protein [Cyanobacteria bacterium J06649_4]